MSYPSEKNSPERLGAPVKVGTKQLVILALMAALAYVVMLVGRIPVVLFLSYDPKDIIITIAGLIYGPLSAAAVSVVVSVLEMLTVSSTGPIGLVMNVLSTCAFACTASLIYKKRRSMSGAVIGLIAGAVTMIAVMLLWNYLITPLYMTGVSRGEIAAMLAPMFLPFNALKAGLNATLTILLYKPVVGALRRASLLPPSTSGKSKRLSSGVILFSLVALATCVLLLLVFMGII